MAVSFAGCASPEDCRCYGTVGDESFDLSCGGSSCVSGHGLICIDPQTIHEERWVCTESVEQVCQLEIENPDGDIEAFEARARVFFATDEPFEEGAGQPKQLGFSCANDAENVFLGASLGEYRGPGITYAPVERETYSTGHGNFGHLDLYTPYNNPDFGCALTIQTGPEVADAKEYGEPVKATFDCTLTAGSRPHRVRGSLVAIPDCMERANPITNPGLSSVCR